MTIEIFIVDGVLFLAQTKTYSNTSYMLYKKVSLNVYVIYVGKGVLLGLKNFFESSVVGALIDCWLWRIINDSTNSENCRVKNWIFENVYISIIFEGGFHINLFRSSKAYKVEKHVLKRIKLGGIFINTFYNCGVK